MNYDSFWSFYATDIGQLQVIATHKGPLQNLAKEQLFAKALASEAADGGGAMGRNIKLNLCIYIYLSMYIYIYLYIYLMLLMYTA